jgi:hypothetical protein
MFEATEFFYKAEFASLAMMSPNRIRSIDRQAVETVEQPSLPGRPTRTP